MYRAYLVASMLALGGYGYAQLKGWSLLPSPAQEFQRARAEQRDSGSTGRIGSGGRSGGGGFSGK